MRATRLAVVAVLLALAGPAIGLAVPAVALGAPADARSRHYRDNVVVTAVPAP